MIIWKIPGSRATITLMVPDMSEETNSSSTTDHAASRDHSDAAALLLLNDAGESEPTELAGPHRNEAR